MALLVSTFGSLILTNLPLYVAIMAGTSVVHDRESGTMPFLLLAPASAVFVGAIGTVISALSRDLRTSLQYTSFFVGLLSLGFGYALVARCRGGQACRSSSRSDAPSPRRSRPSWACG